jgi:hypothetical protein
MHSALRTAAQVRRDTSKGNEMKLPPPTPIAAAVFCALLTGLAAEGTALAQSSTKTTPPMRGSSTTATTTTGSVAIDPTTGAITGLDTLAPGSVVFVLPSPSATTVGAGTAINGVIVPLDSVQVRAILTAFAGGRANLASLEQGLRTGTSISLTGPFGTTTFVPPTTPLTAVDTTQALLLSTSQLAALGITQPTPQDIQASLAGGTVTTPAGQSVALRGILLLHNRGLSFVQIAQVLGQGSTTVPAQTQTGPRMSTTNTGASPRSGFKSDSGTTASTNNNSNTSNIGAGTSGTTSTPSTIGTGTSGTSASNSGISGTSTSSNGSSSTAASPSSAARR